MLLEKMKVGIWFFYTLILFYSFPKSLSLYLYANSTLLYYEIVARNNKSEWKKKSGQVFNAWWDNYANSKSKIIIIGAQIDVWKHYNDNGILAILWFLVLHLITIIKIMIMSLYNNSIFSPSTGQLASVRIVYYLLVLPLRSNNIVRFRTSSFDWNQRVWYF